MKYIALLRGINVGGNNKVPMSELKACFEASGHINVSTYINSGNVIFESDETDETKLVRSCEAAIEKQFGFKVVVAIISAGELIDSMNHAPNWWDKGDAKHNVIFVIAPATAEQVMNEVGESKPEYEKIAHHGKIIFWTAPLKTFSRTRYSKIVGTKAYQSVTIRNANTTKKLFELVS
jgi:uncharacterized protein (DUF1697 family)